MYLLNFYFLKVQLFNYSRLTSKCQCMLYSNNVIVLPFLQLKIEPCMTGLSNLFNKILKRKCVIHWVFFFFFLNLQVNFYSKIFIGKYLGVGLWGNLKDFEIFSIF